MSSVRTDLLPERDKQMLTMAGAHYQRPGARESEVRKLFNTTPTAFYQRINQLLDLEDALAWNPLLVRRLRGQRGSQGRPESSVLGHWLHRDGWEDSAKVKA